MEWLSKENFFKKMKKRYKYFWNYVMHLFLVSWDGSKLEVKKHKVDPLEAVEVTSKGDLTKSQWCS